MGGFVDQRISRSVDGWMVDRQIGGSVDVDCWGQKSINISSCYCVNRSMDLW